MSASDRHPHLGVLHDLVEAVPLGREQLAVEVGGHGVERLRGGGPRGAAPLVTAHHQAFDLLPVVDEQVRIAQRRQRTGPGGEERLGDDVLVRHRHDRHPDSDEAGDLGGEHAAAVDDDLALDVTAVGAHTGDPPPVGRDRRDPRALRDPRPARPGRRGQRVAEPRRVDLPVGRRVRRPEHAVGGHQREQRGGLLRGDQLQGQARPLRPGRLPADLLQPLRARRQPQRPRLHPPGRAVAPGLLQPPVQVRGPPVHPGQGRVGPQLAHQAGRVEGRAAGELRALEEQHVALAALDEVVRHARPADAATDDHDAGAGGQGAGGARCRGVSHTRHRRCRPELLCRGGSGRNGPRPRRGTRRRPGGRGAARHHPGDRGTPAHRRRPARRADQPQPQGHHAVDHRRRAHPRRRAPSCWRSTATPSTATARRRRRPASGRPWCTTAPGTASPSSSCPAAPSPTTTCTTRRSSGWSPPPAGSCTPGRGS